jgi:hypothetical protein
VSWLDKTNPEALRAGLERQLRMDQLDRFYKKLKSGLEVAAFLEGRRALFGDIRARGLIGDYRLGKGRMKRLRDEVTPTAIFLAGHAKDQDIVHFPLNSNAPDCNVWHRTPHQHRMIALTVAQARERPNLMTELNETGWGRGFIGATDDKPKSAFDKTMAESPEAFSTEQVRRTLIDALALCARNKAHSLGDTLIVSTEMGLLSRKSWAEIQPALTLPVARLKFQEVYLVGESDGEEICLKLK